MSNNKSNLALNCIFILYTILLLYRFIKLFIWELNIKNDWGVTEFLVNYQGGFVRRGMIGEILFKIYEYFSISPIPIIIGISIFSYLFVIIIFIRHFNRNNYYWWFLPLPILLGNDIILRKDYLIISLLIIMLLIFKSNIKYNLKIITITIIVILTLNIHEASFFIFTPMMMLIMYNNKEGYRSLKIISCLTIVISLITISYFKGTENTAILIHNSWKNIIPNYIGDFNKNNTIGSIGWETLYAIKFHLKSNFLTKDFYTYAFFIRPFTLFLIYAFTSNYIVTFNKKQIDTTEYQRFSLILLFQFISLSPMFLFLSCDYGRLVMYWLTSSFLFLFFVEKDRLINMFPKKVFDISHKISNTCFCQNRFIMYLGLMFITVAPIGFSIFKAAHRTVFFTIFSSLSKFIDNLI